MKKAVLVLGGYGNFGKRICETLSSHAGIRLLIAGRNKIKADALRDKLRTEKSPADIESVVMDIFSDDFAEQLFTIKPFFGHTHQWAIPGTRLSCAFSVY